MNLEELGWDQFFKKQVNDIDCKDLKVGRVFKVQSRDSLGVLTKEGEINARIPGRMKYQSSEVPAIGDWVLIKPQELGNTLFKVLKRKNHISRKVAGGEYKEQVVGANIDLIFIIM